MSGTGPRRSSRPTTVRGNVNRDPVARLDWTGLFQVEEKNTAAYVQANFEGSNWSGNIGVRFVETEEDTWLRARPSRPDPDAITGSAIRPFQAGPDNHTYDDWLPSANLKWDVDRRSGGAVRGREDHDARRTIRRSPAPFTGRAAGNVSTRSAAAREAIRTSSRSARRTSMPGSNGISRAIRCWASACSTWISTTTSAFGTERQGPTLLTARRFPDGADSSTDLTVPVNAQGRVQGVELQLPAGDQRQLRR